MKTCNTCKWWSKLSDKQPEVESRECYSPKIGSLKLNGLLVIGNIGARIETGPQYGCVNHDPK